MTLLQNARTLRKNMTKEERKLWYDFLRNQKTHWYKQRIVGNYILDFYCASFKLAIELDGSQHFDDDALEYDNKRTEYLNKQGIKVVRFTNRDINNNFEGVCLMIEELTSQSSNADSSPKRG